MLGSAWLRTVRPVLGAIRRRCFARAFAPVRPSLVQGSGTSLPRLVRPPCQRRFRVPAAAACALWATLCGSRTARVAAGGAPKALPRVWHSRWRERQSESGNSRGARWRRSPRSRSRVRSARTRPRQFRPSLSRPPRTRARLASGQLRWTDRTGQARSAARPLRRAPSVRPVGSRARWRRSSRRMRRNPPTRVCATTAAAGPAVAACYSIRAVGRSTRP